MPITYTRQQEGVSKFDSPSQSYFAAEGHSCFVCEGQRRLPSGGKRARLFQQTQNESFYPILLVGINNFGTFAKVMTVTVIMNTILRYGILR